VGGLRETSARRTLQIARWLGERIGRAVRVEKVEPGDEQVLPQREQRQLDSVPSRLAPDDDDH
jgi:hypothetical protein